jgi:hypothetical protein
MRATSPDPDDISVSHLAPDRFEAILKKSQTCSWLGGDVLDEQEAPTWLSHTDNLFQRKLWIVDTAQSTSVPTTASTLLFSTGNGCASPVRKLICIPNLFASFSRYGSMYRVGSTPIQRIPG